jgi:hypothetical protein
VQMESVRVCSNEWTLRSQSSIGKNMKLDSRIRDVPAMAAIWTRSIDLDSTRGWNVGGVFASVLVEHSHPQILAGKQYWK